MSRQAQCCHLMSYIMMRPIYEKCDRRFPQHENGEGHVTQWIINMLAIFYLLPSRFPFLVNRHPENPMSSLVRLAARRRPRHAKIQAELYLKKRLSYH
jgi:hypothetical protein